MFEVCMSFSFKVCIQAVEISCRVLHVRNIMHYHRYQFVCEDARHP